MELKRLSEIYAMTPSLYTKERHEKFTGFYSQWCFFKGTYGNLNFKDAVLLVHGSQGCIGNERTFLSTYFSQYFGNPFQYSPCTDMNSTDTIMGAEDKLRESILEVDRIYRPRMIFLILTCAPGVTKEPVEDIVEEMKSKIKAEIIAIRTEGFRISGECRAYLSDRLSELFRKPEKKIPGSVNILGMSKEVHYEGNFPTDSSELERLLNKIGIKVNSILHQTATIEEAKRAPEAEYNTFDCIQWGYPMAEAMENKFGIPHGKRFLPLGITEISNWIMEVAQFFRIKEKAKILIEEEYKEIKGIWEEAKRLVNGKIVLIDGSDNAASIGRAIAWGRMCQDLGMRTLIYNISPIEVKANPYIVETAKEQGYDPELVYSEYIYHRRFSPMNVIEGLGLNLEDIGLYIGDVFPRAIAKWDKPIFDPSNVPRIITAIHCSRKKGSPGRRVGFRGAAGFARDVIDAVKMAQRKAKPSLFGRVWALK